MCNSVFVVKSIARHSGEMDAIDCICATEALAQRRVYILQQKNPNGEYTWDEYSVQREEIYHV